MTIENYSLSARLLHNGVFIAVLSVCLFIPYLWFGVVPFVSDRTDGPVFTEVEVTPPFAEDELERDVLVEEFRWCRYCHTMQPGAPDEPGPMLYRIFGRQAGTVPGFYYSSAFNQVRDEGLIWTEETLDEFLIDPQAYIPGNRMIHGPVAIADPERRKRVINLLKKWTAIGSTLEAESGAHAQ